MKTHDSHTVYNILMIPMCLVFFQGKLLHWSNDLGSKDTSSLVRETLTNLRVVRSLAAEARQVERYKDLASDVYDLSLQSGMVNATSKSSATLMVQLAVALSLYVAGLAVLTRQVEVGYIITFAGVSVMGLSSVAQLAPLVAQITRSLKATEHVLDLIDRVPEGAASSTGGQYPEGMEGRIELRDVVFDYPVRGKGDEDEGEGEANPRAGPLLKNFSLTLAAGSMTGIVGARRCGKTAIVELIQRMYDVDGGAVLVDGLDVRSLDSDWLRENVAVVHQEPILLGMNIAQNIAYALDSATQAQVS